MKENSEEKEFEKVILGMNFQKIMVDLGRGLVGSSQQMLLSMKKRQ